MQNDTFYAKCGVIIDLCMGMESPGTLGMEKLQSGAYTYFTIVCGASYTPCIAYRKI